MSGDGHSLYRVEMVFQLVDHPGALTYLGIFYRPDGI